MSYKKETKSVMNHDTFKKTVERIKNQNNWRLNTINLIASENVVSKTVGAFAGSDFSHRYAEGHPGKRYYCGTKYIDEIEADLHSTIKKLFGAQLADVRPISGTNANEAVFSKIIGKDDIVMVNSTPGGGHISHHRMGALGKFTNNIIDFPITPDGYHLDVEKSKFLIASIKPKLAVFGKSLFLFPDPVAELVDVCKKSKTIIMYDAAHVLGLIASGKFQQPLQEGAEIMTGSTHKTFFGPQRGVILGNLEENIWKKIDRGVFPGSSSNHHLHTLAQLALSTCEMAEFGKPYADQVIKNAKALAQSLDQKGFSVEAKQFGFTESHQVAVNVKKLGGGSAVSTRLENNDIILNMNMLPHEPLKNHMNPEGLRIGLSEMTRFGMKEAEMDTIAQLMKECIIDNRDVKAEVNRFRQNYQDVHYSFDT